MIELIDKDLRNHNYWINRFMPLERSEYWFNNKKFNLSFSRVEVFDDVMEGVINQVPGFKETWETNVNFMKSVLNDGGIIETNSCGFQMLFDTLTSSNHSKMDILPLLRSYLASLRDNFASCWFLTDTLDQGNRAMWNIYGNSRNENAFMLSMRLNDLLNALEATNQIFHVAKIDYDDESIKPPLFIKDKSYSHEKELRILTLDLKEIIENHKSIELPNSFQKVVTLNHIPSSEDYARLKNSLDENSEIRRSELPIHWKLSEVKKYF